MKEPWSILRRSRRMDQVVTGLMSNRRSCLGLRSNKHLQNCLKINRSWFKTYKWGSHKITLLGGLYNLLLNKKVGFLVRSSRLIDKPKSNLLFFREKQKLKMFKKWSHHRRRKSWRLISNNWFMEVAFMACWSDSRAKGQNSKDWTQKWK